MEFLISYIVPKSGTSDLSSSITIAVAYVTCAFPVMYHKTVIRNKLRERKTLINQCPPYRLDTQGRSFTIH